MQNDTISPAQCRAARCMLGWSQTELSERAKVSRKTIADFETLTEGKARRGPYARTLTDIRTALEGAGIDFIAEGEASAVGGAGVRLRDGR